MKKILVIAVLVLLCVGKASAQGWMAITSDSKNVWDIPFQKVRIRPAEISSFLVPKAFLVTLSEKPNKGTPGKTYNVNSENGFVRNGSKEKIHIDQMTHVGDGWYEYDFGQTLYIQKIGNLVGYQEHDPILILPMGDYALPASATPVQTNGDSNNRANGNLGGPAMPREDQYAFVRDLWPVKKETKNTYGKTVTVEYENGDKIVISNGGMFGNDAVFTGKIHLKDGKVLEGVSDTEVKLHYPDGKVFCGTYEETFDLAVPNNALTHLKNFTTFTPRYGYFIYADGTRDNVSGGKTDSEREKERQQEEAARAQRLKNSKLATQIVGKWKMNTYDGITTTFTFLRDGTYRIRQVYTSPQTRELETISFDVIGTHWKLTDGDAILFWIPLSKVDEGNYITNIKRVYTGSDFNHKRDVRKFNNLDPSMKEWTLTTWLGNCDGNRNYAGIMAGANYTLTNIVISGNKMTAKYTAGANNTREVTLVRVK